MDDELKRVVEAILFAAARRLELSELAKLCKRSEDEVKSVLVEWKAQLDVSSSPTMLIEENGTWRLTVREKYVPVIKRVVTKTELPKSVLETLAVVAYKSPVLQSQVIRIRTNKGYDHLNVLESAKFIIREKKGRTKEIRLAPKFFEYFDIDPSKLKSKFASLGEVERTIEAKEKEIEMQEVARRREAGARLGSAQVVIDGVRVEQYDAVVPVNELLPTGVEVVEEKLGDLEVCDVPMSEIPGVEVVSKEKRVGEKKVYEGVTENVDNVSAEVSSGEIMSSAVLQGEQGEVPKISREASEVRVEREVEETAKKAKSRSFEGKGLFSQGLPEGLAKKIDERVRELMGEKKEEGKEE